jgi:type II secretory pathway pseudopilin PulG
MVQSSRGITMVELLIAMFIFTVGIVGVLSAIPTGVRTADQVIFQDSAIHLAQSKFAEFRRDRVDPGVDLIDGSPYLPINGTYVVGSGLQEPTNGNAGNWRDFAGKNGEPFHYFDRIESYEWKVTTAPVGMGAGVNPPAPANYFQPVVIGAGGKSDMDIYHVIVTVRRKGRAEEFSFAQYIHYYGK